jgi:hypothetical protein
MTPADTLDEAAHDFAIRLEQWIPLRRPAKP